MKKIGVLLVVPVFLALVSLATAEVPQMINYQGRLTESSGASVADGPYLIKFKIYGSESGMDSLWSSGYQTVQVMGGLFTYQLGSSAQIPSGIFATDTLRYLGITVGTDAEIIPRTRLITVAYAYHSQRADTAEYALDGVGGDDNDWAGAGSGSMYPSNLTDKVGIGTSNPQADFDVSGTARMTGFQMPTDAVDGYVLVSNGAGAGTWQPAAGSGHFPAPAYNSGWFYLSKGGNATINHFLGHNPNDFFVDLQFMETDDPKGINVCYYGGYLGSTGAQYGAYYRDLDSNSIRIYRKTDDYMADSIRVRIWIVD